MPLIRLLTILAILCVFYNGTAYAQIAVKSGLVKRTTLVGFTTPDTVCVTQPVNITNTSTGASSYYWNFCVADILNTPPTGVNLGNPGGFFNVPVFSDFVEDGGNYYVFVVNNANGTVTRLDFGNSLLNTPTGVNLGNFGGVLIHHTEGIQIVKEGGKWYGFVVAGDKDLLDTPQIIKIEFGTNISNNSPIATNWGNIGNMNQPLDLYMFKDNANWYGFTVDKEGNVIRFNFGTDFTNPPGFTKYTALGLVYPTGVNVINENGSWYVFVTTANDNGLTRLDFGNSLLNTPIATHLGNPDNVFNSPRDIYIIKLCDALAGFVVNGGSNGEGQDIVRLNFNNDLKSIPTGVSLGNIGNFQFPHSLSKLFRVGDKVYTFITNAFNNTITRLEFPSCNNSDRASSTLKDPPSIKYNTPGVYNINLTVDDGLPTQSSFCRQVVVVPEPTHTPTQTITLQNGESIKIGSGNPSKTHEWNTGATTDSITVNTEGTYIIKTSGYGCENIDTIIIKKQVSNTASFNIPDTVCVTQPVNITNTSTGASSYYWNFCVADINKAPTGTNFGNVGGLLAAPVFMDYVFYNGKYYGFLTDHNPGALIRLDFGNSLLNTPTAVNLGNFGGIIPPGPGAEGIQMIFNEGKWYAIIVGGYDLEGSTPRIMKIDFGPDPSNLSPVATNWGNVGNMSQPIDLHVFKEGNNWFGLTVNAESNTLTRFNFTNSFDNVPTGTNLGNVNGQFAYPTGVYAIENNGDWKVFVVNGGDRTRISGVYSLVRLDFGSSLLNTPTAVNLGNPGNLLQHPRDISIMKSCDQIIGFGVNGLLGNSDIIKLDFGNDLSTIPQASTLGNVGNLSFPHSISKLFREGDNLYCFITNSDNNSLVRLQFTGCTNSSLQSSTAQNPPQIKYDTAGIYHINLTLDDGLPTQSSYCRQVVVVPEPVHTPTKTIIINQGETVKIGTGNASGTYKWNTTTDNKDSITVQNEGLYYVATQGYGCDNIDSFLVVFKTSTGDFSYQQDACDPLKLTFKNETPDVTVIDWDFGNGFNAPGNANPTTTYPGFNTYTVVLTIKNALGTTSQITKQIPVSIQTDSLIITRDTIICAGASIQLNAIAALNYCWSPTETLNNSTIANPIATPTISTTYFLNTLITGANIIVNGDFSGGNTGFTSEYGYANPNTLDGQYFVGANPNVWNPSTSACKDHTSGNGNMLLVNGAPNPDVKVWQQTINVVPNTNYAFSTWIQSIYDQNPAQLQFSINGVDIGTPITASLPTCTWNQFYTVWNSGNNTNATIAITNKNTETLIWGNDFALDDISFAPVFIKRDSVRINVEKPVITASNDTAVCAGSSAQLSASQGFSSYSWTPAASLSNGNINNPVAKPAQAIQYIVSATSVNGCNAKDTVNITVNALPLVITNNDTLVCGTNAVQLNTSGSAVEYVWTPNTGLSDPLIKNPIANPLTSTQYIVTGKSADGCTASDTVNIKVGTVLSIKTNNDTLICENNSVQLQTSGNVANYVWAPSSGLSNSTISNPIATPSGTTQYIVTATSADGCSGKDTVTISVNARPVVSINNDTLVCNRASIQLNASAAGMVSYEWSPVSNLDNAFVFNPLAKPGTNTKYTVVVTDVTTGCFNSNSVQVSVRPYPTFGAMSDINICKGTNVQLHASGGDDYEWSPAGSLDDAQSPSPMANPASTTQYSVHITDLICNYDTLINVNVGVNSPPLVAAQKSNDINCEQPTSQLTARGADNFIWTPANHLDNATKYNPVASIDTTTMFIVKGTTTNGCYSYDSVTVKVTKEGNPLYLVPNAFTPNNDGINDCLSLKKWGSVQLQEFSIYNRWGERVFTTTNPMACWDGTFKGQPQNIGTFVYVVRAKTFCGTVTRKGLVTLIR